MKWFPVPQAIPPGTKILTTTDCGEEKEQAEGENDVHEYNQLHVMVLKWERHAGMPALDIALTGWFHSQKLWTTSPRVIKSMSKSFSQARNICGQQSCPKAHISSGLWCIQFNQCKMPQFWTTLSLGSAKWFVNNIYISNILCICSWKVSLSILYVRTHTMRQVQRDS